MSENFILISIAIVIVIGALLFLVIRLYHKSISQQNTLNDPKEIANRDNQIKKLNIKINNLSALNSRYLSFMLKVPIIIQRLNSTLRLKEITLSIIELVNDVVKTDKVELYLFDSAKNLLRKLSV